MALPSQSDLRVVASTIKDLYEALYDLHKYDATQAPKRTTIHAPIGVNIDAMTPMGRAHWFTTIGAISRQICATWGQGAQLDVECTFSTPPDLLTVHCTDIYQREMDIRNTRCRDRCRMACVLLIRFLRTKLVQRGTVQKNMVSLIARTLWQSRLTNDWDDDLDWVIGNVKRNKWEPDDDGSAEDDCK
jgi:hypothetical protein